MTRRRKRRRRRRRQRRSLERRIKKAKKKEGCSSKEGDNAADRQTDSRFVNFDKIARRPDASSRRRPFRRVFTPPYLPGLQRYIVKRNGGGNCQRGTIADGVNYAAAAFNGRGGEIAWTSPLPDFFRKKIARLQLHLIFKVL